VPKCLRHRCRSVSRHFGTSAEVSRPNCPGAEVSRFFLDLVPKCLVIHNSHCNRKSRENECAWINSLYGRHIYFWGIESVGIARDLPNFCLPPIIPGTGKATNFKFCAHIHRVSQNRSHEEVVAVGVVMESRKFSGHPYMGRMHYAVIFVITQLSC